MFHAREHLEIFIKNYATHLGQILRLLHDPITISHLQVLGLIDQLITGPLWRLAEHSPHVLDTCPHIEDILAWVRCSLSTPSLFLRGTTPILSHPCPPKTFDIEGELLMALTSLPSSETSEAAVLPVSWLWKSICAAFFEIFFQGPIL